jgi:hypothetical protein
VDDLVQFLRDRLDEDVERARTIGNMLITAGLGRLGITTEAAEQQARSSSYAAEMKAALFEETVRPYLGTAGPTGRIAEQQLRFLAATYCDHRDYRPEWRPSPPGA